MYQEHSEKMTQYAQYYACRGGCITMHRQLRLQNKTNGHGTVMRDGMINVYTW